MVRLSGLGKMRRSRVARPFTDAPPKETGVGDRGRGGTAGVAPTEGDPGPQDGATAGKLPPGSPPRIETARDAGAARPLKDQQGLGKAARPWADANAAVRCEAKSPGGPCVVQREHKLGQFFGPATLVELLRHRALYQPHDRAFTFLVDGEQEELHLTYSELDRQARAIAGWLGEQGLSGQRVLLLYPPGLDFIAGFFGCLYAGVVAVTAYPPRMNRSLDRIQAIVADADAQAALTTRSVLDRVQPLLEQTPDLRRLRWLVTDELPGGHDALWRDPPIGTSSIAFLQYTSGSTGTPKGVVLTHGNLLHNCALISYAFEHTRSGSGVFWLPSYHDMGLVGGILQPLWIGRPNVLMSPMAFLQRPYRWLQAISKYRGTTSGGPNFAYELCLQKVTPEQRDRLDLSSWQVAFNGAEPVRADTVARFAEYFAPCGFRADAFYPCYGLAESTLIVTGGWKPAAPVVRAFDARALEQRRVEPATAGEDARTLVGAGSRLPDLRVEIVDPETRRPAAPGAVGEIWVAGPSVAQGYWQRHDENEQTFRARLAGGDGPFMRTGDLGFFDQDELFIAGRLKDMIILNGVNHYPQDIELTVEQCHDAIRATSVAAFGMEVDGVERVAVVAELERRTKVDYETVLDAIRRAVSRHHELQLGLIRLIKAGSIPKTSSGKIQRHAARTALRDNDLEVLAAWDGLAGATAAVPSEPAAPRAAAAPATPAPTASAAPAAEPAPELRIADHRARETEGIAAAGGEPTKVSLAASTNGSAAPSAAQSPTLISTAEAVLEEVQRVGKERARGLTLDTNILELGLDSLERMEIVAALEQRFGRRFPEEVVADMETCRDVVAAVDKYLVAPSAGAAAAALGPGELPASFYRFEAYPEYQKLRQNLDTLVSSGLGNPYFAVHERITNETALIDGREYVNFCSYNYLGMSGDPRVAQAAKDAIDRYGTSVSASRVVAGEKRLHRELEQALARFVGADDAIVYVGGHSTNETTIGHLFGPGDLILHDALSHNSIIQGCLLSGARRRPFPHNDWRAVDEILSEVRKDYRRVLIAVEGVYSMDGDIPQLPKFIEVKERHKAQLMVDEAHSIGTLGAHGRGIGEHFGIDPRQVDLWMGTLSKSFGSCGGYIAGCRALVEYLKYTSPGFVYSVGISPPNAASALASIEVLEAEPQRVARLHDRARLFLRLAQERHLNTGLSKDSPVVPVILGNSVHALQLSRALAARGINVMPILYPAVEEKAARLRFFLTSRHTDEQIRLAVEATAEELARINPRYFPAAVAASAAAHA